MKSNWICAGIAAVLLIGACGGDTGRETSEPAPTENARAVRDEEARLPDSQKDSLRVMSIRYNVTRDEYWSGYGGVLGNDHFDVWYPAGNTSITHGMAALKRLEEARRRAIPLFGAEELPKLTVVCSKSLPWYEENTGQTWWHYSRLTTEQITLQPMMMLYQRGLIDIAIKKEYFRWITRVRSKERAPMWIEYGLAALLANERKIVEDQMGEFRGDPIVRDLSRIEASLKAETDKKETRIANYNAFRMVEEIVGQYGEQKLGDLVVALGNDEDIDAACRRLFEGSYDALVRSGMEWKKELGR